MAGEAADPAPPWPDLASPRPDPRPGRPAWPAVTRSRVGGGGGDDGSAGQPLPSARTAASGSRPYAAVPAGSGRQVRPARGAHLGGASFSGCGGGPGTSTRHHGRWRSCGLRRCGQRRPSSPPAVVGGRTGPSGRASRTGGVLGLGVTAAATGSAGQLPPPGSPRPPFAADRWSPALALRSRTSARVPVDRAGRQCASVRGRSWVGSVVEAAASGKPASHLPPALLRPGGAPGGSAVLVLPRGGAGLKDGTVPAAPPHRERCSGRRRNGRQRLSSPPGGGLTDDACRDGGRRLRAMAFG